MGFVVTGDEVSVAGCVVAGDLQAVFDAVGRMNGRHLPERAAARITGAFTPCSVTNYWCGCGS
ncbi:hypothetical protein [Streptomyces alanosinicus]|uniref:hypothetical protein n=1 Tax=Streptomyces alanosinicus TaxID=68171 RepID=UPI001672AC15|nr:hypothetical protein [Streptomyces alanosinicus]